MAIVKFVCPHCSYQLSLPSEFQGKHGECPSCNQKVKIDGLVVGADRSVTGPLAVSPGHAPPPVNSTPLSPPPLTNVGDINATPENGGTPPPSNVFCRNCGSSMLRSAAVCPSCGVPKGYGNRFCPYCKAQTHEAAVMCVACGRQLTEASVTGHEGGRADGKPTVVRSIAEAVEGIAGESREYYRDEFQSIQDAGGGFKASFNWAAFLLGPIWYLYHGMWKKALILIGVSFLTFAIATPLIWAYAGIASNYDLYLLKVKGKELW